MRAPQSERNATLELPAIAADILERLRAAQAARALHHQCGGAEFHRQHAAGGRRGAVDDASRRRRSARSPRAPTRCWSISAPSIRSGRRRRSRRSASPTRPAFPGCSIRCSSTARRRARRSPRRSWRRSRARCGSIARSLARWQAAKPTTRRWRALPRRRRTVVGLTGERDLVRDAARLAAIANGHPLMARVTAMGCAASALVGATLAVEPDAWKAAAAALIVIGVAGEIAARARARPRQLRRGNPRCAVRARPRHADRKSKGELMRRVDLRCYAIVDPEVAGGHELADLCRMLAAGGVTLVQLRDKLSRHARHGRARPRDQGGARLACRS